MRKKWIIAITIIALVIAMTSAFAYGKSTVESKSDQSYFDSLNDYDWSGACPGASCRNHNEEQ